MKLKMKLKARSNYGQNVLLADCPEADALFELMKPRKHLLTSELPTLYKLGFEAEIGGKDVRDLMLEMQKEQMPHENHVIKTGKLEYKG